MEDELTLQRLNSLTEDAWKIIISKCYTHINLQLAGKTKFGAHCSQRLGMDAKEFYLEKAIVALFEGTWQWKYELYPLEIQLTRIIDSMMSEQVRKYAVEVKGNKRTVLVENNSLFAAHEETQPSYEEDLSYYNTLTEALNKACENNEKYKRFISLKRQGLSYPDLCKVMECTLNEAYRIMENISRRANKILKSL